MILVTAQEIANFRMARSPSQVRWKVASGFTQPGLFKMNCSAVYLTRRIEIDPRYGRSEKNFGLRKPKVLNESQN